MRQSALIVCTVLALAGCSVPTARHAAQLPADNAALVAKRFAALRDDPVALARFMRAFPKGGDIHHHLIGAPTPETLIEVGIAQGYCAHPATLAVTRGPCAGELQPLAQVMADAAQRERLIDLWSMRGFGRGDDRAAEHFFGIFPLIWPVVEDRGELLARLMIAAQAENVLYLETQLQVPAPTEQLRALAMQSGAQPDVLALREQLRSRPEFAGIVQDARDGLRAYRARARERLQCDGVRAHRACSVATRFQIYALRILPLPMVFADMILAFELAASVEEVVAVNVVGYEGDAVALADYDQHMRALRALSGVYPGVNLASHAGELTAREAGPKALGDHIEQAVYVAGARRIGHGVAIASADNRAQLLRDLAQQRRAIEVCLTSNELLLGVAGDQHPLQLLWDAGVPVVLATDDAGIFRTDLSREYTLAASRYPWLSYADFKTLARRSIDLSFLPGESLWRNVEQAEPVAQCKARQSDECGVFLGSNRRAAVAAQLELALQNFEAALINSELSP